MKSNMNSNPAPRLGPKTVPSNQKTTLQKKKTLKKDNSLNESSSKRSSIIKENEKQSSSKNIISKLNSSKSIEKQVTPDLQFIFEGGSDAYPTKPYYSDGDPSMYTAEAVKEREQLKNDVEVKQQVYNFMKHYRFDENGQLSKNEYFSVQLQLATLLRQDLNSEYMQGELKYILEQDWKHDSKGKEKMNKDDLYQSLFELVDIWTPTTKKQE